MLTIKPITAIMRCSSPDANDSSSGPILKTTVHQMPSRLVRGVNLAALKSMTAYRIAEGGHYEINLRVAVSLIAG
jgi:hypothetical protein